MHFMWKEEGSVSHGRKVGERGVNNDVFQEEIKVARISRIFSEAAIA
jgi:hypothetical protein